MDTPNLNDQFLAAVKKGDAYHVLSFIKQGISIDTRFAHGNTALIWAAINNHFEVAQLLIKMKINIGAENNHGKTALYYSALKEYNNITYLLLSNLPQSKMLELEQNDFFSQSLKQFQQEKQKKIPPVLSCIDEQNDLGQTMLMIAVRDGHVETVKTLLNYAADTEKTDIYGKSALDWATIGNHEIIIKLLSSSNEIENNILEKGLGSLRITRDEEDKPFFLKTKLPDFIISKAPQNTEVREDKFINTNLLYPPPKKTKKKITTSLK